MGFKDLFFRVPRRAARCFKDSALLKDEGVYLSTLSTSETGLIERRDFCIKCQEAAKEHSFDASWIGEIKEIRQTLTLSLKDRKALKLFLEWIDLDKSKEELFFLAMYLKRRGVLFLKEKMVIEDVEMGLFQTKDETEELLLPFRFPPLEDVASLASEIRGVLESS